MDIARHDDAIRAKGRGKPFPAGESGRSRNRPDSPVFRVAARGGPLWGPNVTVDCVVRLSDGAGRSYLLRADGQPIAAVQ